MKKVTGLLLSIALVLAGCSSNNDTNANANAADSATQSAGQSGTKTKDKLVMVWYPNESGPEIKPAREAIGKIIEEATGKKVEHQTTTDYIIAIEAIASGNADIAYMGPQGYIEANAKNDKVQPLVVPSGESGTLDDAIYHSWLAVRKGEDGTYKSGDGYSIEQIAGKKFSFVSNSSTSGFKVPSANITGFFGKQDKFKDLTAEDLIEGGSGKLFSEVLFGGSHQGSAVNLLTGKADVAAFCDTCVSNYVDLESGDANTPGATYKVKEDAAEPFNTLPGKEFTLISDTPVLNSPFAVNTDSFSAEDIQKMKDAFTSDATTKNTAVFLPKDSKDSGLFKQKSGNEKFLVVEDAWFEPVRALSK